MTAMYVDIAFEKQDLENMKKGIAVEYLFRMLRNLFGTHVFMSTRKRHVDEKKT